MMSSTSNLSAPTIVSCSGKVLLAGGYLVLARQHHGFVLSTPSRFYTVVRDLVRERTDPLTFKITVDSPQFVGARWVYDVARAEHADTGTDADADEKDPSWTVRADPNNASCNAFVHLSIQSTISLASALFPSLGHSLAVSDLHILIVGSNDFYSQQRAHSTERSPSPKKMFAHLGCAIADVHKTGLGSSAAMTTSLVAALLLHLDARASNLSSPLPAAAPNPSAQAPNAPSTLSTSPSYPIKFPKNLIANSQLWVDQGTLGLIHNLAQYVHSLAQGKVGSGFDVSAAVWGSQVYRRFESVCLGQSLQERKTLTPKALLNQLSPLLNPAWTNNRTAPNVAPFALPPAMTLLLADVDAGSHTPSMVGKVLAWKKAEKEQADRIWSELHQANNDFAEILAKLGRGAKENPEFYDEQVQRFSTMSSREWSESSGFKIASQHILSIRALMREMGERSKVPIEPAEQTKLLDAVSELPGVVGAGVPGAGGYDAIWVLALSPPSTNTAPHPLGKVQDTLIGWKEMSVRPLSKLAWIERSASVEMVGLKRERMEEVDGLMEVVEAVVV
ncbi:BZ3500_MvSof-1268-A1-R1_Chr11-3g03631 [Microbotryum saponariae]|uniref:Phosphomevalonate kinase n=1 Tax=Microbotryum saponariae TaxID=289078 RepID=A0A2X0KN14_9BASI|nr:BZ3500_MvSof-1268-A1-R1_Chr11-3g03631 [Microbotryum saponariae]